MRLVTLRRLCPAALAQCAALRQEAGRCGTDLVWAHQQARQQGRWLNVPDLGQMAAGQYALHSQSIQALAQKLDANLQTATQLRQQEATQGEVATKYPYHPKPYQTVVWKNQALQVQAGQLRLSNGVRRDPLRLPLPDEYQHGDIRKVELTWRADHYELCLTLGRPFPIRREATP